jgi:protein-S-isoprenylcysteine O-methyltransferase Ste14
MTDSNAYGMWALVGLNAAIFVVFVLSYLKPKKWREWRSMGAFGAFVVALFTEMYGFPLSVYVLTSVLGSRYPVTNPFSHTNGNLWAVFLGGSEYVSGFLMLVGGVSMFAGLVVMGRAWKQIHAAGGDLVTTGLYARMRHPQYFALFVITLGMFIQWPTIVTLVMWPVLMFMYYRLALREEKAMESVFGERYTEYARNIPMFFPRLGPAQRHADSLGRV